MANKRNAPATTLPATTGNAPATLPPVVLGKYAKHHTAAGSIAALPATWRLHGAWLAPGNAPPQGRGGPSVMARIHACVVAVCNHYGHAVPAPLVAAAMAQMCWQQHPSAYGKGGGGQVCAAWVAGYLSGAVRQGWLRASYTPPAGVATVPATVPALPASLLPLPPA